MKIRKDRTAPAHSAVTVGDDGTSVEMVSLTSPTARGYFSLAWIGSELPKVSLELAVKRNHGNECQMLIDGSTQQSIKKEVEAKLLLHVATSENKSKILRLLLAKIPTETILMRNGSGQTAFHIAIEKQYLDCCIHLLQAEQTNLVENYSNGSSPLHYIAQHYTSTHNCTEICKEIMKYATPSIINKVNKRGETALHLAAKESHDVILKLLLENGGRPDMKTDFKYTPLHFAAECGFDRCVQILVDSRTGNRQNYLNFTTKDESTALHLAAKKGFTECCRFLEGTLVDYPDKTGCTALHHAAGKGYFSTVQYLISIKADASLKNKNGHSALYQAATNVNEECLRFLLDPVNGVKINETPEELLHVATKKNCYKTMELLLSYAKFRDVIDIRTIDSNTLLHIAVKKGNFRIADLLLKNGADRTIKNVQNEYPLHLAAGQIKANNSCNEQERLDICKLLLISSHMMVNECDVNNETVLHRAARADNVMVVRLLLRKGSKVLALNKAGLTPVHVAAHTGNNESLKVLLRACAANRSKGIAGCNPHPLHLAAQNGHLLCCKTIIRELKINKLMMPNDDNMHPVDLAYKHKKYDVFKYLLKEIPYRVDQEEFSCRIHEYCREALKEKKTAVVEAIIESEWWHVAFNGYYCDALRSGKDTTLGGPCKSFTRLIRECPEIACRVMDKCITRPWQDSNKLRYNFIFLEYIYYDKQGDGSVQPVFSGEPPYGLTPSVEEFSSVRWGSDHPLVAASLAGHTAVLAHPLTKCWLKHKFTSYARWLLLAYVLIDVITAVFTTLMFSNIRNISQLQISFANAPKEAICTAYDLVKYSAMNSSTETIEEFLAVDSCSSILNATAKVTADTPMHSVLLNGVNVSDFTMSRQDMCTIVQLERGTPLIVPLQIVVFILFLFHLLFDMRYIFGLGRATQEVLSLTRSVRLVCLSALLLPLSSCQFNLGLRGEIQWLFGVGAVLVTWLNLVSTFNKVPMFTVFMPVTPRFIWNYLRVIMYISIIILAFALAFHYLLIEQAAFSNMWHSLIKTLVWMLGDLGYDDTFLNEEFTLPYPILTNAIFVMFVTTIGGFVFNLIITKADAHFQEIKDRAAFHQANAFVKLHLLIDDWVPGLRKKFAKSHIDITEGYRRRSQNAAVFHSSFSFDRGSSEEKRVRDHSDGEDEDGDAVNNTELMKQVLQGLLEQKEQMRELTSKVNALKSV